MTCQRRFWMTVQSVGFCLLLASPARTSPPVTCGPFTDDDRGFAGPSLDLNDFGGRFLPLALTRRSAARPWLSTTGSQPAGADVELGGWNESCVAVNPTNPMNLAYSSLFELRVSTDGGVSWQPAVSMPAAAPYFIQGDPCVAFDHTGRLFWSYCSAPVGPYVIGTGCDIFIAQCDPATGAILPGYPVNVTAPIGRPASGGHTNDKPWMAVDSNPGSPFAGRLYVAWTDFPPSGIEVTLTAHSSDQGLTWSPPVQLGPAGSGSLFIWPAHLAVAPNGDLYVADHRQGGYSGGAPNGLTGYVDVFRSVDGGVTFPQSSQAFPAGLADMTTNIQTTIGAVPGARFLMQGSVQPWVLPDPLTPGRVFVVACDDPDNNPSFGDAANVYMATSIDHGLHWSAPLRVDSGPGSSFQVMPVACIEPGTGTIVVTYYDNRNGVTNGVGDYLLDVFAAVSLDGGNTFKPDFRINDRSFDPDAGARCRYGCGPLLADVWAPGGDKAFAVTNDGTLLAYDSGTWTIAASIAAPVFELWGSGLDDVLMCGIDGTMFRYDGVQVIPEATGSSAWLFAVDGRSSTDVYVVGQAGTVLHDAGSGWMPLSPPTSNDLQEVWVNPTGSVFMVGTGGVVLRYDGGWTDLSLGTDENLFGVWGSSDTDVYASSVEGGLHHWDGVHWSEVDPGAGFRSGIWGSSANEVFSLGFGRVRQFDGETWVERAISEHMLWKANGSGPTDVFAVGENAAIVHFDGVAWEQQINPLTPANPTQRIGEYNGLATRGERSFATWCGNTSVGEAPLDQQAIFDAFQSTDLVSVRLVAPGGVAPRLSIESIRPNPARGSLALAFTLPTSGNMDLSLIDLVGRRVATLERGTWTPGRYVVSWEVAGHGSVPPGIYFLRLAQGSEVTSRRVAIVP